MAAAVEKRWVPLTQVERSRLPLDRDRVQAYHTVGLLTGAGTTKRLRRWPARHRRRGLPLLWAIARGEWDAQRFEQKGLP
jgi:hypothetical protein